MSFTLLNISLQGVSRVITDSDGGATGVALDDGSEIKSKIVLSNATPRVTFLHLVEQVNCYSILPYPSLW